MSARCLAVFCCNTKPASKYNRGSWWLDYGCCSRGCVIDYYGPEVLP